VQWAPKKIRKIKKKVWKGRGKEIHRGKGGTEKEYIPSRGIKTKKTIQGGNQTSRRMRIFTAQ